MATKMSSGEFYNNEIRHVTGSYQDQRIITVELQFDATTVPMDATVAEIRLVVNGVQVKAMRPYDRNARRMGLDASAYPNH